MPDSEPSLISLLSENPQASGKIFRDVSKSLDILEKILEQEHIKFDTLEHHEELYRELLGETRECLDDLISRKVAVDAESVIQLHDNLETLFMPLVGNIPEEHRDYIKSAGREAVKNYLKDFGGGALWDLPDAFYDGGGALVITSVIVANVGRIYGLQLPENIKTADVVAAGGVLVLLGGLGHSVKKAYELYQLGKEDAGEATVVTGDGLTKEFLENSLRADGKLWSDSSVLGRRGGVTRDRD